MNTITNFWDEIIEKGTASSVEEPIATQPTAEEEGSTPPVLEKDTEDPDNILGSLLSEEEDEATPEGEGSPEITTELDTDNTDTLRVLAQDIKDLLPEGFEIDKVSSPEDLLQGVNDFIEGRTEAAIKAEIDAFADNPEAAEYLNFLRDGGTFEEYVALRSDSEIDLAAIDFDDEAQATRVMTRNLRATTNMSDEDIQDHIETLVSKGKLSSKAREVAGKDQEEAKAAREQAVKQKEADRQSRLQKAKQYNRDLKDSLKTVETVGMFTVGPKEKSELDAYIFQSTEDYGEHKVPKFQADMAAIIKGETPEDRQKQIVLAAILKSGFSPETLVASIKNNVVKDVKSNLSSHVTEKKAKAPGGYFYEKFGK